MKYALVAQGRDLNESETWDDAEGDSSIIPLQFEADHAIVAVQRVLSEMENPAFMMDYMFEKFNLLFEFNVGDSEWQEIGSFYFSVNEWSVICRGKRDD